MQSAFRITILLVLLSSAFAGYRSSAKLRRDGVLNLYPFPRVGRSGPHSITHYPRVSVNGMLLEYDPIEKRLISFPRVGRSPSSSHHAEQTGMWFGPRVGRSEPYQPKSADQLGMWYGPRVGRSFNNDAEDFADQIDINGSEPEQIEPTHEE